MTEEPTACALPGCSATIEQPEDGGPPRRYCSPAHRAAARKQRHVAAQTETEEAGPAAPAALTVPTAPAEAAEQATAEPLPPSRPSPKPWSAAASWLITPTPPPPPRPVRPAGENRGTARSTGERKRAAVLLRQRAVASIAVASLIAGGGGYLLTQTPVPVAPPPAPPAAPQPSVDPAQWAARAEVVLASINKQLDTVAVTEASWNRLPEAQRAGQPAALQALQERKALLEQQRATLQSQIGAFRSLPDVTTDLTTAQAQLDAVERALRTAPPEPASPDQAETIRTLAAQRDVHRQQRDYNSQELEVLRHGVDEAVSAPLPDASDRTTSIAQQVIALIERRPDPKPRAQKPQQELAIAPRRESTREERNTVSSTAPPDPSRPKADGRSTTDLAVALRGSSGSGNGAQGGASNVAASAVRTGGAVLRTAGDVVDTARQVVTGRSDSDREPGADRQSGSGNRNEQSSERVRPVSNVVNTVTGSLLGHGNERRSSSESGSSNQSDSGNRSGSDRKPSAGDRNEQSSERVRPVSNVVDTVTGSLLGRGSERRTSSESGSSKGSTPAGKAERSQSGNARTPTSSSASRNDRQQASGRSTAGKQQPKENTPRGKAERIKDRVGTALGNAGRALDPAQARGGSTEGKSGSEGTRTGNGRSASKGEGRGTDTRNNAATGSRSGTSTDSGSTGRAKSPAKSSSTSKNGGSTAGSKKSSTTTSPGTKTARNKKSTKTGPSSSNTAKRSTSGGSKSDAGKSSSGGSSKSGGSDAKK